MAIIRRPMGLLAYIALIGLLATGRWYLTPFVLLIIVVTDAQRQLDTRLWRLHGWRMRDERPPALPDVPNLPLIDAVGLIALAAAITLPWGEATWVMRACVLLHVTIVLIGWRIGSVVFRPEGCQPSPVAALPVGRYVEAKASGSLLTRNFLTNVRVGNEDSIHTVILRNVTPLEYEPRHFRMLPTRVLCVPTWGPVLPDGRSAPPGDRLILLTPPARAGLSLCRPDLRSVEPGRLILTRSSSPALRLGTVLGRLVLAFDSDADRAVAWNAIRAELG